MTLKEKLNNLIVNNQPGKAIDLLMNKVKDSDKDTFNTLVLLKSRYASNEKDNTLGIISREEYRRTNAQITVAFQQTMENIAFIDEDTERTEHYTQNQDSIKQEQRSHQKNINQKNMNKILIVTATKRETKAILETAESILKTKSKIKIFGNEAVNVLGTLGNSELYHSQCEAGAEGVGGAQAVITDLIHELKPSSILMPGIAFGLQKEKQKIGDIIVSTHIRQYEKARIGKDEIIPRGDKIPASPKLIGLFRAIQQRWDETDLHFGTVMSGEKLVDNPDFIDYLHSIEPEAVGGEMEGVGLYTAAYRAKVDWILFKAIVDWGMGKTDDHQVKSSETVAKLLFEVLEVLCEETVESNSREEETGSKKNSGDGHQQEILELLINKKHTLEKDLILTYDSEKKFALQEQIKELEKQIEEKKKKL